MKTTGELFWSCYLSLSLLSIVPDDDISVACYLFCAGIVGERISALKPLPQLTQKMMGQKHQEGHGGDCDNVSIFVISFLHYGSFLEWPASTVVDLVHESPSHLRRCMQPLGVV